MLNEDLPLSECTVLLAIDEEEAFTGHVLMQWSLGIIFTTCTHAMSDRPHHTHTDSL